MPAMPTISPACTWKLTPASTSAVARPGRRAAPLCARPRGRHARRCSNGLPMTSSISASSVRPVDRLRGDELAVAQHRDAIWRGRRPRRSGARRTPPRCPTPRRAGSARTAARPRRQEGSRWARRGRAASSPRPASTRPARWPRRSVRSWPGAPPGGARRRSSRGSASALRAAFRSARQLIRPAR